MAETFIFDDTYYETIMGPFLLRNSTEEEIRRVIRDWLQLLTAENFIAAAGALTSIPGSEAVFTDEIIKRCIGSYSRKYREAQGSEKERFVPKVSDPGALPSSGERIELYRNVGRDCVEVEYTMPLDGEWSDLTACFEIFRMHGEYRLGLIDIRVL